MDGQWFATANIAMARLCAISGMVSDERGEPLPGVYVRVVTTVMAAGFPQIAAGAVVKTDDRGVYRMVGLKPGAYIVNVPSVQSTLPTSAPDDAPLVAIDGDTSVVVGRYPTAPPSAGRPLIYRLVFFPNAPVVTSASPIELSPGEERSGVDFRLELVPGVRISGRLEGPPEAIAGQVVRLMPAGSEELGVGSEAATALTTADGKFTLANVPAGRYTIDVRRTSAQFQQRADSSAIGMLETNLPQPPGRADLGMRAYSGGPDLWIFQRVTANDAGESYVGQFALNVGAIDLSGVVVPMRPGVTMRGTVVWEGTPSDWGTTSVQAEPARGSPLLGTRSTQAVFDTAETFLINGLLPGEYVLRVTNARSGGLLKSVRWKDRDYTDLAFDASSGQDFNGVVVTLTTMKIGLGGTVHQGPGLTAPNSSVVAFPAEREQWTGYGLTATRIKATAVSQAGAYSVKDLPAGDYYLVAVDASQSAAWKDPKWLESASRFATRVTLRWGDSVSQDLTVVLVK